MGYSMPDEEKRKMIDGVDMCWCTKCKEYKPSTEFLKRIDLKTGLASECKNHDPRVNRNPD